MTIKTVSVEKAWGDGTVDVTLEEFQKKFLDHQQLYLLVDYTELDSMTKYLDRIKGMIDNLATRKFDILHERQNKPKD
jgi:hypothetical protein